MFSIGEIEAGLRIGEASAQAAMAAYRGAFIATLREVQTQKEQLQQQQAAQAAQKKATEPPGAPPATAPPPAPGTPPPAAPPAPAAPPVPLDPTQQALVALSEQLQQQQSAVLTLASTLLNFTNQTRAQLKDLAGGLNELGQVVWGQQAEDEAEGDGFSDTDADASDDADDDANGDVDDVADVDAMSAVQKQTIFERKAIQDTILDGAPPPRFGGKFASSGVADIAAAIRSNLAPVADAVPPMPPMPAADAIPNGVDNFPALARRLRHHRDSEATQKPQE